MVDATGVRQPHGGAGVLALAHPSVVTLLRRCGPATIGGFVIAVVVDAIKGVTVWPISHVCQKIGEVTPPVAERDATTSISWIVCDARVQASLSHRAPAAVSAALLTVLCVPMLRDGVRVEASAAPCVVAEQTCRGDECIGSAVTSAVPDNADRSVGAPVRRSQGCEPSEALSRQVFVVSPASAADDLALNQMVRANDVALTARAVASPETAISVLNGRLFYNGKTTEYTSAQVNASYAGVDHLGCSPVATSMVMGRWLDQQPPTRLILPTIAPEVQS